VIEQQIDIPTRDGATTTFVVHPERDGPHPVIIFYMDAPAIREELRDMCRRLASVGYFVVLPNLYYRSGVLELGPLADPAARSRMFELMESLSVAKIMDDTQALLGWIDSHPAARPGSVGTVGYCMSGQYALNAAVSFPGRVTAAASVYGVRLVTEDKDSPHLAGGRTKAELYVACAETDHWAPLDMVRILEAALADAGADAEVEIYPGVEHGFAFPQRAAYNRDAAERHWERIFALFRRRLG
jgi:carboxymethylenebutenolidase